MKKQVTEARQENRNEAIKFVKFWVDGTLKGYKEPPRSGVRKGHPIGFPLKKKKAALFLVLYPFALKLKDIGKMAGVSENVIRVWRTQRDFEWAIRDAEDSLSKVITDEGEENLLVYDPSKVRNESINERVERWKAKSYNELKPDQQAERRLYRLGCFLPFLSLRISDRIYAWLREQLDKRDNLNYLYLANIFEQCFASCKGEVRRRRDWGMSHHDMRPGIFELTKIAIEKNIDVLVNPEKWNLKREEVAKRGEEVKKMIFNQLAILRG